jgi:hypothetical protein
MILVIMGITCLLTENTLSLMIIKRVLIRNPMKIGPIEGIILVIRNLIISNIRMKFLNIKGITGMTMAPLINPIRIGRVILIIGQHQVTMAPLINPIHIAKVILIIGQCQVTMAPLINPIHIARVILIIGQHQVTMGRAMNA